MGCLLIDNFGDQGERNRLLQSVFHHTQETAGIADTFFLSASSFCLINMNGHILLVL